MSHFIWNMSPVTGHLSPVTNANSQQPQPPTLPLLTPQLCTVGGFTKTLKKVENFQKKGML